MEFEEIEEGEIVDKDRAFSYFDQRIYHALGDLRKYFEGDITEENLGPMFGGYGTFLPTKPRPQSILFPEPATSSVDVTLPPPSPPILFPPPSSVNATLRQQLLHENKKKEADRSIAARESNNAANCVGGRVNPRDRERSELRVTIKLGSCSSSTRKLRFLDKPIKKTTRKSIRPAADAGLRHRPKSLITTLGHI